MSKEIIRISGLTKSYGKQRGIVNLSFSINEGEIFGFLGPNGAGKTTTIRTLLNFLRPSKGSAQILGHDSVKEELKIKGRVGYLPGELNLYENMTGKEFLKFIAGFKEKVDWNFVEQLAVRIKAQLNKKIKKLSHGNKQKIGILTAFMHKPKLLILDEPTTGLDPLVQHEFYDILHELRDSGATVLISSHNLAEVEKNCDRVAVIKDGNLVVVEEIETLRKKALRPLEVIFSNPVKESDFSKLTGIRDLKVEGKLLRCVVVGSIDTFVKAIAKHDVESLMSQEPDLEEIFLSYYEGGK